MVKGVLRRWMGSENDVGLNPPSEVEFRNQRNGGMPKKRSGISLFHRPRQNHPKDVSSCDAGNRGDERKPRARSKDHEHSRRVQPVVDVFRNVYFRPNGRLGRHNQFIDGTIQQAEEYPMPSFPLPSGSVACHRFNETYGRDIANPLKEEVKENTSEEETASATAGTTKESCTLADLISSLNICGACVQAEPQTRCELEGDENPPILEHRVIENVPSEISFSKRNAASTKPWKRNHVLLSELGEGSSEASEDSVATSILGRLRKKQQAKLPFQPKLRVYVQKPQRQRSNESSVDGSVLTTPDTSLSQQM